MYADNKHYREYQRMLVKLHTLIGNGDGDSTQAIELRQEMDEPEAHLSEEEAFRLNFRSLAMELLWSDDRFSQAYSRAKTYLIDPTIPTRLHLVSGGIVSRQAQQDQLPIDIKATSIYPSSPLGP